MNAALLALAVTAAGVDEHVGDRVPADVSFTDSDGRPVRLGDQFDGERPVLLVMAYARCTMLCSVVLQGVVQSVSGMALEPGRDYRLVLVSLDDRESAVEALDKQAALLGRIGRTGERWRWPYLLGTRAAIDRLAAALGFRYAWDPVTEQYAHPAVAFVLTPQGRIAAYLHGVRFPAEPVAAALRAAAAGLPTVPDEPSDILRCFSFDPAQRRWADRLRLYFRIGASVVFLVVGGAIAGLVRHERRRRR